MKCWKLNIPLKDIRQGNIDPDSRADWLNGVKGWFTPGTVGADWKMQYIFIWGAAGTHLIIWSIYLGINMAHLPYQMSNRLPPSNCLFISLVYHLIYFPLSPFRIRGLNDPYPSIPVSFVSHLGFWNDKPFFISSLLRRL